MCIMNTILKIPGEKQMKKIDPALLALLSLDTTEEQLIITEKEAEMLSRGELTFHNGHLYRTENLIPQEVVIVDLTAETVIPLKLYGDDKQRPKLQDLTIGTREWTQEKHGYNFNRRPTQAQIERCKQFPPIEIKGVHLKSSKLSPVTQEAVKSLIAVIENNKGKHPYVWVGQANILAEFAGEEAKPLLLEILNSAVPLKEGMKLEGFSAKEFELKYLHSRPSLLEQAEQELLQVDPGYKPTFNMIDARTHENLGPLNPSAEDLVPRPLDTNQVVERPTYLEPSIPPEVKAIIRQLDGILVRIHSSADNKSLGSWEEFRNTALDMSTDYENAVKLKGTYTVEDNWEAALQLQDWYWDCFRGYSITIIRLLNTIDPLRDERYNLPTPIEGMKKLRNSVTRNFRHI